MNKISVIIPAFNEEQNIGIVVTEVKQAGYSNVIVVDNNSSDKTGEVAEKAGAIVVFEETKGYGAACLRGIKEVKENALIVFMDGDGSDNAAEISALIKCLKENNADLVIGSRIKSSNLSIVNKIGTKLALFLINITCFRKFKDLGPFRVVKKKSLDELKMEDKTWGWTVEMQVKAVRKKFKIVEYDVSYRKRFSGKSKISGTLLGIVRAAFKIIYSVFKYRFF